MRLPRSSLGALLAVVSLFTGPCTAHSTQRGPLNYISIVEQPKLISPAHRVHAHANFDITFALHAGQQRIKLVLEPNHDILPDSVTVRYRHPDGSLTEPEPVDRRAHKVFRGSAYVQRVGRSGYREVGWARVTVERDGDEDPVFVGAFELDGDIHHVLRARTYMELRHPLDPLVGEDDHGGHMMVVWRDSDVAPAGVEELRRRGTAEDEAGCGADRLGYNSRYRPLDTRDEGSMHSLDGSMHPLGGSMHSLAVLGRRQIDGTTGTSATTAGLNLVANIGSHLGCPTARRIALMGVATDCTYTASFDSEQDARANVITQVNLASAVYERTFNISLGIKAIEISKAECPATPSADAAWNTGCGAGSPAISDRLNLFSAWRGKQPDSNAFWTLLSTCNTGSAVGLAWLGQLCVTAATTGAASDGGTETVSGANVVVKTMTEWQVLAHEIGHTFGAVHDCIPDTCSAAPSSCCPLSGSTCDADAKFIMNPSTVQGITDFSLCTVGNICGAMNIGSTKSACLSANRDVQTITGSQCGNGIVEPGEQCDCGGPDACGDSPCCDAATCRFKGAAVCDPSNEECCAASCQLAPKGTVCRPSDGICDPAETCTGASPDCPTNAHSPDGSSCGGGGLACASGQCTSRDAQCRTLLGTGANDTSTRACNDESTCQLCCYSETLPTSPETFAQNYMDGTTCQAGGKCAAGTCSGSSVGSELAEWFSDNKRIIIPVAAVVGGLLVLALVLCCISTVRQRMRRARAAQAKGVDGAMYGGGADGNRGGGGGWSTYGGAWGSGSPGHIPNPPPRAALSPSQRQMSSTSDWRAERQAPMRYA